MSVCMPMPMYMDMAMYMPMYMAMSMAMFVHADCTRDAAWLRRLIKGAELSCSS